MIEGPIIFALARVREKEPELKRDWVAPLYYIFNERGDLCFSSEVKDFCLMEEK